MPKGEIEVSVLCVLCLLLFTVFVYQVEGVDSRGRYYLLEWPSPSEVQENLWRMVLSANKAKDELKEQLKKKVEELKRQEQNLKDWQHHLDLR